MAASGSDRASSPWAPSRLIASTTLGAGRRGRGCRTPAPAVAAGPRRGGARRQAGGVLADLRGSALVPARPGPRPRWRARRSAPGARARSATGSSGRSISPRESFAAGPFGPIVLVGSDDGIGSRLQALDVAGGCAWAIADERDVIRRATIDPAGHVHLRDARRSRDAGRPRHLATVRDRTDTVPRQVLAAPSARRPIRAHVLDRVHLGRRRATGSRSSRAARSPAGPGVIDPGGGPA